MCRVGLGKCGVGFWDDVAKTGRDGQNLMVADLETA